MQDADPVSPHCGARRAAPPCPRCGAPVTSAMSRRVIQEHERGYYPWHAGWNGRCEACGFDFAMSVQAEPGHYGLVGQGASPTEIEIRGGESVYTSFDSWEHQPTVEIRLKRQLASNAGSGEGRLGTEASIVLTPAEWTAIARALSGPLRVLLDRPRWTRDRT
ncbi:MAG: hypothetical protein IT372_21045 [Polyangiaceae bacterium]|nr:hypothetical protein [Polyangiaceae bacterium]